MLKYSLQSSPFPNALPLGGATITTGTRIFVFYEPSVNTDAPYTFLDNGVKVGNTESQAPIELMNGNGWIPTQGAHTVTIQIKTGAVKETASFTVVTINTPPPSDTKKITWKLKSTGEIIGEFSYYESQTEITIV